MQNFVFGVRVTTDTYEHAVRVMKEYLGDQEPVFESGVEIDYKIEVESAVEGPLLAAR